MTTAIWSLRQTNGWDLSSAWMTRATFVVDYREET